MMWLFRLMVVLLSLVSGAGNRGASSPATNTSGADATGDGISTETPSSRSPGSFLPPTATDYALQVALRNAINANYRFTAKSIDPTALPDQSNDDLSASRDAAADALARLLPSSFGRQGVLDLFDPEKPVSRWQQIRHRFSQPDHWLCVATAEDTFAVMPSKSSRIVQVILGEIDSRVAVTVKTWDQSAPVQIIRLKEGATSKPLGYFAKLPPAAEAVDASTVVIHVDRLARQVKQFEQARDSLANIDFAAHDAAIRVHFINERNTLAAMAPEAALRMCQEEPFDSAAIEKFSVMEVVAQSRTLADPQYMFALTHCGANVAERLRVVKDRVELCLMAESDLPLGGLYALISNAATSRPVDTRLAGPSATISSVTIESIAQQLAQLPPVAAAVAAAPASTAAQPSYATVNFEALLQAFNASSDQLRQAATAMEGPEYARSLVSLLRTGAKAGIKIPTETADQMLLLAMQRSPQDERLALEIGILYYYQKRDDAAAKCFLSLTENSQDSELKADAFAWESDIDTRNRKPDAALSDLGKAVDLMPTSTSRLAHYGFLLAKSGNTTKAAEMYNRYLAIDSTSPQAVDVRQRLAALGPSSTTAPTSQATP